jgi:hypothetical protein
MKIIEGFENSYILKRILIAGLICLMFLVPFISAQDCTMLGTFAQGTNITLRQTCDSCTYVTLGSIVYPNSSSLLIDKNMTKVGFDYSYFYTTDVNGEYYYNVFGDKNGDLATETFCFQVGDQFGYWIILIGTALAIIFLICSLFVPEEFFVYISGVFFLIEGIYIMINGFALVNNTNTRMFAYIYLGIGILFTVGAYIFNLYSEGNENSNSEEEE